MIDHNLDNFCDNDIHGWFGLTYASYLVIPRSVMQSMPAEWQHKFVELLEECEEQYDTPDYTVYRRDKNGRFIHDEFRDYERGRRFIAPNKEENHV